MSNESVTKSILSDCKEKADQPVVTERGFTMIMKFPKISLTIVICLLILCLGVILGLVLSELSYMARYQQTDEQIGDFHQYVYLFDTEQKLEDYYKTMEAVFPPGFPRTSDMMALVGRDQPLVAAGPFVIFVDNENGDFSVRDSQSLMQIVVWGKPRWALDKQSKYLQLSSLLEKGWTEPRFIAGLRYSEDGFYEGGFFAFNRANGERDRTYYHSKESGVFDKMSVYEYDVDVPDKFVMPTMYRYRLNGLTWEREGEGQLMGMPPPPVPPLLPGMPGVPPPGSPFIP